jgi:hypothetical protein
MCVLQGIYFPGHHVLEHCGCVLLLLQDMYFAGCHVLIKL